MTPQGRWGLESEAVSTDQSGIGVTAKGCLLQCQSQAWVCPGR